MPSRRRFLGAIGTGALVGIGGCQQLIPSDGSDAEPLMYTLLAEPNVEHLAGEPTMKMQEGHWELISADAAGLREHADHVSPRLAERGVIGRFASDAETAAMETIDRTCQASLTGQLESGGLVSGHLSYAEGDVDQQSYEPAYDIDPTPTEYRDFQVYDFHGSGAVALGESTLVVGSYWIPGADEDGTSTGDQPDAVREGIDRLVERPTPPSWVEDGLDAARPFHYLYGALVVDDGGESLVVKVREVHGEETTYRYVLAAPTPERFEDAWDREDAEEAANDEFRDREPTFDVGETVGTVTVTGPTSETDLGRDE